jgi:GTP-binding protein
MLPVVALVGRPNVGKSTLFNALTQSRQALVADEPGVTRDRQYGEARGTHPFIVVDTGGLVNKAQGMAELIFKNAAIAVQEADLIYFIVDAKTGVTPEDQHIAAFLRKLNKPLLLVVNKIDGKDPEQSGHEFYALGLGTPVGISATHREHLNTLFERTWPILAKSPSTSAAPIEIKGIKIALVGRPNVGKSTLTNRMLGEERVLASEIPGTTRDSIYIPFVHHGVEYTLIDTAGVRRRGRISETVEKFSVIKTLQAIRDANVVIFLVDAQEGLTDQDLHLLGFVLDAGRSIVIAINKWDGLSVEQKEHVKTEIARRFDFISYAQIFFISGLHGTNVGHLFDAVQEAYKASTQELPTPKLTALLEQAVFEHNPPMVKGRRIKLKYVHCGGYHPPTLILHGNQLQNLPASYLRYLEKFYRQALHMVGTPIRFECKIAANPYAQRREKLTPRQQHSGRKLQKKLGRTPKNKPSRSSR